MTNSQSLSSLWTTRRLILTLNKSASSARSFHNLAFAPCKCQDLFNWNPRNWPMYEKEKGKRNDGLTYLLFTARPNIKRYKRTGGPNSYNVFGRGWIFSLRYNTHSWNTKSHCTSRSLLKILPLQILLLFCLFILSFGVWYSSVGSIRRPWTKSWLICELLLGSYKSQ